jgi:hypothetical protein
MAILHRTDLRPHKLELLAGWLPLQPWFAGDKEAALVQVGQFRFDDPAGLVGVETLLVRAGDGPVMQVPLTYRNDPLPGAEESLIGTMEHGVLGTRWTYDAVADPVYRGELERAIRTGGTQVDQWIELDGVMTIREPTAHVVGSGTETDAPMPDAPVQDDDIEVVRIPADGAANAARLATGPVLSGTWTDQSEAVVLARIVHGTR